MTQYLDKRLIYNLPAVIISVLSTCSPAMSNNSPTLQLTTDSPTRRIASYKKLMDFLSDISLEKELKEFSNKLEEAEKKEESVFPKKPIDYKTVLAVHKLLKRKKLWNLLPKKEQYSGKKSNP